MMIVFPKILFLCGFGCFIEVVVMRVHMLGRVGGSSACG
jgi:hypothetical protein